MIEESVKVVAIEEHILVLEAQRQSSCQSCSVQKGCGTSVLSQWLGKKISLFHVENTIDAQVGDSLLVGIPESRLLTGSLLLYLVPIVGLFVGAALASWQIPESKYHDLWVSLSGVVGLIASFRLSKALLSHIPSEELNPVILRKNSEHVKLTR